MNGDIALNNKKTIRAWAIFDWANSAYALVISTAIFPPFFAAMTPDQVDIWGMSISNTALFSFSISISYLFLVFINPILAGIADSGGRRKYFLNIFTTLGALACMSLFFFDNEGYVWWGTIGFILATIGYTAGTVFYNAYLPEIVSEDQYDRVSAKGFAYGYVGSVILLIAILILIQFPEKFGMEASSLQARIGFLLVGIWWIGFAQYSFKRLPDDKVGIPLDKPIKKGLQELKKAWVKIKSSKHVSRFLASFFFYIAGLNTVVYLATIFAKEELGITQSKLIVTVLLIQILGIAGAYLFAYVSRVRGTKTAIGIMIFIWMVICVVGFFVAGEYAFYGLASAVGLVMGGTQAVSRSAYAKMVDDNSEELNSFFSLYEVVRNIAVVAGTMVFGLVDQITSNMRYSILSVAVFFMIGLLILSVTNIKGAKA